MEQFIFNGIEDDRARIGVVISEHEVHDFLMTKEDVITNMNSFGPHPAFEEAHNALSASLSDVS